MPLAKTAESGCTQSMPILYSGMEKARYLPSSARMLPLVLGSTSSRVVFLESVRSGLWMNCRSMMRPTTTSAMSTNTR